MADLLQEIHAQNGRLLERVGELAGQVKMLVDQGRIQDDRAVELETRMTTKHDALEARVRTVEGRQHWYAAVAATLSAVGTYLIQGLWKH